MEIIKIHLTLIATSGDQRCLITYVGDIGSCKTRGHFTQDLRLYGRPNLDIFQMHLENSLPTRQVRTLESNLTIKTTRTHQCTIENIRTIGGGHDDDALVRTETIHFYEQLVERILTLIIATLEGVATTGTTDSINLIDEDDTRCFLPGLLEQIPHA